MEHQLARVTKDALKRVWPKLSGLLGLRADQLHDARSERRITTVYCSIISRHACSTQGGQWALIAPAVQSSLPAIPMSE